MLDVEVSKIELHTHNKMILAIAESNRIRQQKNENNTFIILPLLDDFGYLGYKEMDKQAIKGTYVVPEGTCKYAKEIKIKWT